MFIGLLNAGNTMILSGEHKQKKLTIDLSKNNVKIRETYTVPKGKTLILINKGMINPTNPEESDPRKFSRT